MKSAKSLAVLILSLVTLAACAVAQQPESNMNEKTRPAQSKPSPAGQRQEDFKILASGQQSDIEEAFIYVARAPETYARLTAFAENLPAASDIDFRRTAVVAAFAGMKPTGGFSVEIKKAGERISVATKAPGKEMMVTQIITAPFKIALVPIENDEPVALDLSAEWTSKSQKFKVLKANFEFTGGIAGIRREFTAQGTIEAFAQNGLVTLVLDLKGGGAEKNRRLFGVASGALVDGNVLLERVDAGSFADNPHPPLKAAGKMNEKQLSLSFESHQPLIADGFICRGTLEASKIK